MSVDLILASGSSSRQNMLRQAGYDFDIMPADIDEEAIIKNCLDEGVALSDVPLLLAKEKALFVSKKNKEKYIIGSDQVLVMDNKIYSKAKNKNEALERLNEFQGKEHILNSAVSVFKNGNEIFSFQDSATLAMKELSPDDIKNYCDKAGDVLTACVGCYALESLGIRLFKNIEGNYFTILGMPLLPLINFLDSEGFK